MANVIVEMNERLSLITNSVNQNRNILQNLDNIIGMYIRMKGDMEDFNKYVEKEIEKRKQERENDSKGNGEPDKPNLQGNTDGEGSGSEGVRKEEK